MTIRQSELLQTSADIFRLVACASSKTNGVFRGHKARSLSWRGPVVRRGSCLYVRSWCVAGRLCQGSGSVSSTAHPVHFTHGHCGRGHAVRRFRKMREITTKFSQVHLCSRSGYIAAFRLCSWSFLLQINISLSFHNHFRVGKLTLIGVSELTPRLWCY